MMAAMEVVHDPIARTSTRGAVITIGAYDGVHLGHQAVLRLVHDLAAARGLDAVVCTFATHPAYVVRPESAPQLLTTLEQKLELLGATGLVNRTCVLTFDAARAAESAETFVRETLVERLGARAVVVGADFHFGKERRGNVALLDELGTELGFEAIGLNLVASDHAPISSTRIRELVATGAVAEAAQLLGRPHEVRGTVVRGDQRGRTLGYPTANLLVPTEMCLPADGIYAGTVVGADGVERMTAISLGRRPTFYAEANASLLEAHVLDFDGDLYGQQVAVRFVAWLRGEQRFDSVEALVEQMGRDCARARQLLGGAPNA
ncbi:MAG: bifunctional riboflavin kinase/FAD synthetase [Acidimicrobiia bacterium]